MPIQSLQDPDILPSDSVLQQAMGEAAYSAYQCLQETVISAGASADWKYYRDGKAWLCKVSQRGKTLFWLSVWNGFFRCSFHFSGRTRGGVAELTIDPLLRQTFLAAPMVGRLVTLPLDIRDSSDLADFYPVFDYQRAQK